MGWKSDWLYHLIINEFRKAWKKAQKEGSGNFGPCSDEMIVYQYSGCDLNNSRCNGECLRAWIFNGDAFEAVSPDRVEKLKKSETQGMFYKQATGQFNISKNRRHVVLEYIFGPRYGRGYVFDVVGQGKKGCLQLKPGNAFWVS